MSIFTVADRALVFALAEHTPARAARLLGVSAQHLRRAVHRLADRVDAAGGDGTPIRKLIGQRPSTISMSELSGADLASAVGLFGHEPALRR